MLQQQQGEQEVFEQKRDFKDRDAFLFKIIDAVARRGMLPLIDCMRLKLLSRSFNRKYGAKDQILYFVALCHCTQSAHSGSWGYEEEAMDDPTTSMQFRFWKHSLVTPAVLESHIQRYGMGVEGDPSSHYVNFYARLAALNAEANTSSPGQMGEIMRDVRRTFPSHPFFREGARGNIMLGRVLRAFSTARPDIGYCQGMNFVVGVFILARLPVSETGGCNISSANAAANSSPTKHNSSSSASVAIAESSSSSPSISADEVLEMTQEADVFLMMISLVSPQSALDMSGMWAPGVPKMKLRVFQFDRLFKSSLPKLHHHFDNLKLAPEVLVAQWIITLYSYTVPVPITMGLWDYIMLGGWAAMYRVALTILSYKEKELLVMDLDEVGKTMREWKGTQIIGGVAAPATTSLICIDDWSTTFLLSCDNIPITNEVLLQMNEHYGLELIYSAENQEAGNMIRVKYEQDGDGIVGGSDNKRGSPPVIRRDHSTSSLGSISSKTRELEPSQVGWFQRYGEDLSPIAQTDMTDLAEELRSMDVQVEKDKVCLQRKILETCDMVKTADERARKAIRKQGALKLQASELERTLEDTIWRSEKIAYYVGVLVNTTGNVNMNLPKMPSTMDSDEGITSNSTGGNGTASPSRDTSLASEVSDITAMSELDSEKCSHFVEDLEAEYMSKDDVNQNRSSEDLTNNNGRISPTMTSVVKSSSSNKRDNDSKDRRLFGGIGSGSKDESSKVSNLKDVKAPLEKEKKGIGALFRGITKHFGNKNTNNNNWSSNSNSNNKKNNKEGNSADNNSDNGRSVNISSTLNNNNNNNNCDGREGRGNVSDGSVQETVRIHNGSVFINIGDEEAKQQALLSRIQFFSQESNKCQVEIIDITRKLTELKLALVKADKFMQSAVMVAEDAIIRKKSLCEQLQLLSQSANDVRSRKLLTAVDKHGM